MDNKQLISRNIEVFYNNASEETRLDKGMGIFEFERIKTLIEKYIPHSNSKIIDVGGGTGKYSKWLAEKGHEVHLVEPIPKHIEIAKQRAQSSKKKFTIKQGESRDLKYPNNYADLVILHGPLYHLQKKGDRDLTILEAKRVLKRNGIILGFAINYTASTLVGLLSGLIHKKSFFEMCKTELTSSIHHQPEDFPWILPESYYHKPDELKKEFIDLDLMFINIYAVEGMAWLDKNYFVNMVDKRKKKTLEELIRITENDHQLLSFSPHMMIAVKKQNKYEK
ncbi:MAG: class I SAM-dependent methyltransferase [Flavobacteriales bacterium]